MVLKFKVHAYRIRIQGEAGLGRKMCCCCACLCRKSDKKKTDQHMESVEIGEGAAMDGAL